MLSKTLVILISGKAGVGKSTAARYFNNFFLNDGYETTIVPFASELKTLAMYLGWNGKKDEKGRQFLIELGQVARKYDKNVWAKFAYSAIVEDPVTIDIALIDDWRFMNEGLFFANDPFIQTYFVRVEAPERELLKGTDQYNDESENSLPSQCDSMNLYDYCIDNSGSLEQLEQQINKIASDILSRCEKYGKEN